MTNKIKDIYNNLTKDLNLKYLMKNKFIDLVKLEYRNTIDILIWKKDLDLFRKIKLSILKSKTRNFDSFLNEKKLKDIDLTFKPSFNDKLKWILTYKRSLTWKPLSFFREKRLFSRDFFKKLWFVFSIIFVLMFLDKALVENRINAWYEKLLSIRENTWDINFIKQSINNSKFDFILTDILFKPFLLIPNSNVENWYYIINWWKNLTKLLDEWVQIYSSLKSFIDTKNNIEDIEFSFLLSDLRKDFSNLKNLLSDTILNYNKVWNLWIEWLNSKLDFAREKLVSAYKILDIIERDYDIFLWLLWHKSERKYLVLFQNNDEIRPTWWFIWSLATLTLKNWKVTSLVNDDIYAYEWEINKQYTNKIPAPEWLNKITWTFWIRDANYYVDFKDSSNSINNFLKMINKDVDWIIYINQNTILDFLKVTWWINFDLLWETINEENFSLIISTLVEAKVFKVWTLWSPKQILFDFANVFLAKLKQDKDFYTYLDIIVKNIKSRDIVIYSFNPDENNLLWKLWLNWNINYSDSLDFSYPVYTSIWWNKSDRYIELKYKKEIGKNVDCSIDTKMTIYRTHFFSKFEEEKVNNLLDSHGVEFKRDIINIQWRWENKEYVRVVLPKDIEVSPKYWMTVNKFPNSTVLEFYMNTRLLETTYYDFNYRILNKSCEDYSFKFYKQSWIRDYNLEIQDWTKKIKEYWIKTDFFY